MGEPALDVLVAERSRPEFPLPAGCLLPGTEGKHQARLFYLQGSMRRVTVPPQEGREGESLELHPLSHMKGGIGCYPKTPAQKWGSRGQAGFGESDGLKDPETFVPRIVSFPSLAFSWDFVSRRGKRGFRTSARNFAGIPLAQSAHI